MYLEEQAKRELEGLARRTGRSEAELIREAVALLLSTQERRRPTVPLFRSGDPALAERVDEELEGFGA